MNSHAQNAAVEDSSSIQSATTSESSFIAHCATVQANIVTRYTADYLAAMKPAREKTLRQRPTPDDQCKFHFTDEERWFLCQWLPRCPMCGLFPRLSERNVRRGNLWVGTYEVRCSSVVCNFCVGPDQTHYSRAEAVQAWSTYCTLVDSR